MDMDDDEGNNVVQEVVEQNPEQPHENEEMDQQEDESLKIIDEPFRGTRLLAPEEDASAL